VTDASL